MKPLNNLYNFFILKRQHVEHGTNFRINGRIYIYGKIVFGNDVSINSGFKYNPIGGQDRTIFYVRDKGNIIIGDNVGISNSAFFSTSSIRVEKNVRIGGGCKFYDNDFHSCHCSRSWVGSVS